MSRTNAFATLSMDEYKEQMKGIYSTCIGEKTLDESPMDILTLKNRNAVSVELYISDDKSIYHHLFKHKDEIESKLGLVLDWRELPDKKASRIIIEKPVNLDNRDEWNQQFDWIVDVCIKFKKVFKKYL